jgi:hypothetical protein
MEEVKSIDDGARREPHPRVKTFGPMLLSGIAILISLGTAGTQQGALKEQQEQLETQREQLETQREAVDAQEQALKDADERWRADGPVLEATSQLRGISDGTLGPAGSAFLATIDGEPIVHFSDDEYRRFDEIFLEVTVTNIGKAPGLLTGLEVQLRGDTLSPEDDPFIMLEASPGGDGRSKEIPVDYLFSGSAECVEEGIAAPCQFPLRVDSLDEAVLRMDLSTYPANRFQCQEGGRGEISIELRMPNDESIRPTSLMVDNDRECTE